MDFKTSKAEGPVDFVNVFDLEKMAQQVIPKGAFGYIASGAGDTFTLHENIRSFNHKLIVPHTLKGVENPDTSLTFAEDQLSSPIIMAPVAAHKLANEQGEVASAKGVSDFGTIYTTSSYSSTDLPEITQALNGAPHWFQFYFSKDDGINRHIMDRVKEQGVKAIVLTADATVGGNRFLVTCLLCKSTFLRGLASQWILFIAPLNRPCRQKTLNLLPSILVFLFM